MCKVYTGYCGTSEIEHGLCACTVDNPLAIARGLSLRTGAQPMLYLPLIVSKTCNGKSGHWQLLLSHYGYLDYFLQNYCVCVCVF